MAELFKLPDEVAKDFWSMGHFPERFQFVIFRNWNRVPVEQLASVLKTTPAQIFEEAKRLGLGEYQPSQCDLWMRRGYLTIIRDNWHLLNYNQLTKLLKIDNNKLYRILVEEDFMLHKMGNKKPYCPEVYWTKLSKEAELKTAEISSIVSPLVHKDYSEFEFDFLKVLEAPSSRKPCKNESEKLRLIYSYCAPYGDVLLPGGDDPFPEGLLEQYRASNINAVWYPLLLSSLTPWTGDEDYSENWQLRQESLRRLVKKLAGYGIKFIGYLNEPRALPKEIAARHPTWCGPEHYDGSGMRALCIQNDEVFNALSKGIQDLCTAVPGIDGFFTISMSENLTHCYSKYNPKGCPICSSLETPVDNIVKVNKAILKGIRSANSNARLIAWNWGWDPPWDLEVLDRLPSEIELMCVSETGLETDCCNIKGKIIDYSLSHPGPGPVAPRLWDYAKGQGRKRIAKIQLNATWELSSLPYIPVPQLAKRHLDNLKELGIEDFMLSWTLGGAPGGNLSLTDCSISEWCKAISEDFSEELERACQCFSDGFAKFPFNNAGLIYEGPQNFGCSNLIYSEPSNREATMVGFCYDDVKSWAGYWHYPAEVLEKTFFEMTSHWQQGLEIMAELDKKLNGNQKFNELYNIAQGGFAILQSSANQIAFYNRRDDRCGEKAEMRSLVENEIELAKLMLQCQHNDSRIGFEASNHYMYGENNLLEKIVNCYHILSRMR